MSRKELLKQVEDHAAHTPWVEEGDQFHAIVKVYLEARNKEGQSCDVETGEPTDDIYELEALASMGRARVRYLGRKKRYDDLQLEQRKEIMVALGLICDQVVALDGACLSKGLQIYMERPPDEDGAQASGDETDQAPPPSL